MKPFFWVKIHKFFDADTGTRMEKFGSGMEKSKLRIRDKTFRIHNTEFFHRGYRILKEFKYFNPKKNGF
jgi:hypothetical protein